MTLQTSGNTLTLLPGPNPGVDKRHGLIISATGRTRSGRTHAFTLSRG